MRHPLVSTLPTPAFSPALALVAASLLVCISAPAAAYECHPSPGGCPPCILRPDTGAEYSFVSGDFTSAEEDEIVEALGMFDGGTGQTNRGFTWAWSGGSSVGSQELGNEINEVAMLTGEDFTDLCGEGASACHISLWPITASPGCVAHDWESDIIMNGDDAWQASEPLTTDPASDSIGYVAAHEFGHGMGLKHDNTVQGLMSGGTHGVTAGTTGIGLYRLPESEYTGIKAHKPDATTGVNLALSRFTDMDQAEDPPLPDSTIVWNCHPTSGGCGEYARTWSAAPEETIEGGDGPRALTLWFNGTSAVTDVVVKWALSTNTSCTVGDIVIGAKVVSAASNTPTFLTTPDLTVPDGTSAGSYYLCAIADWPDDVNETSEADNWVISKYADFEVETP